MLHRKEYKAIAQIIKDVKEWTKEDIATLALQDLSCRLADYLQNDNPLFNKSKFLEACK